MAFEINNKNYQAQLNYVLTIDRAPEVNYFIQTVNLPGISVGVANMPTPFKNLPIQGDHCIFEDLRIGFKVQEGMADWWGIFNWIQGIGFPVKYEQYSELKHGEQRNLDGKLPSPPRPARKGGDLYSDVSLTILTSKHNPYLVINFVDAYPVALSELSFDSTDTTVRHLTATAVFKYDYYYVSKP